jgi:TRAP-type C4-dicarboxylate transport system permease small subunit
MERDRRENGWDEVSEIKTSPGFSGQAPRWSLAFRNLVSGEVSMTLKRTMESFDGISRYFSIAGGWALFGLSFLIAVDVVGRKLFNTSTQGSDEIGGYVMAAVCAFGFSYALTRRSHIRLNIMLPWLPIPVRVIANLIAYLILGFFAYMMAWRAGAVLMETIRLDAVAPTPLETPMIIPHSVWTLGLIWFAVHLTAYLLVFLGLLAKRQVLELLKIFDVEPPSEEAAHEVEGILDEIKDTVQKLD